MFNPSKKIKILHTIRQGMIGGGETHVLDLVQDLNPDLFESHVLSFTEGEMVTRLARLNIPCHVIHTVRGFDFRIWKKVEALIKDQQYDIVHAHGTRACSNSYYPCKKAKVPLIYTIHGWSYHPDQPFLIRTFRELSEKFLVRQSKLNITVSKSNQTLGKEKLGMPNSIVIKNGIDLKKYNPEAKLSLSREELGLPADKLLIGMVARMTKQKDPITFIRAAARLAKRRNDVHFIIVGGGELEPDCKAEVEQLQLKEKFTFLGFRTDIPEILDMLDVYCLPSLWEGLPIGILEAQAMKTPVIATPVDGTKEIIKHGETGLLFPVHDVDSFATQIEKLAENKELRKALSENGRKEIETFYSSKRVASQVEHHYLDLLTDRG